MVGPARCAVRERPRWDTLGFDPGTMLVHAPQVEAAARRPYHVLRSDHYPHVVAESFEAIQDSVHGAGFERNRPDDAM